MLWFTVEPMRTVAMPMMRAVPIIWTLPPTMNCFLISLILLIENSRPMTNSSSTTPISEICSICSTFVISSSASGPMSTPASSSPTVDGTRTRWQITVAMAPTAKMMAMSSSIDMRAPRCVTVSAGP